MKSLYPFCFSPIFLAIITSAPVNAEELERSPLLNISDVIVVKGTQPSAIEQSVTRWQLTEQDLIDSGASTLAEALKNVPGLYVRVGGEGTPRIDIRGLKTRHIIYLINGVPANNANDGQFDPSVIPTSQIASVEVSVGPTSVLYGAGGAGGVINILTKQGTNAPSLSGKLEYADENTVNADISGAASGDDWQGMVSFSHQETDGYNLSNDYEAQKYQQDDTRDNADKQVDSLYGQLSYWLSDDTMLSGNVSLRSGEWGKPSRDGSSESKSKFERVDDYDEQTLQFGGAHQFNERLTLRGFIYHNQSDVKELIYDDESYSQIKETQDGRSRVQGANIQAIMQLSDASTLTTSLISEYQSWESLSVAVGGKKGPKTEASDDNYWLHTVAGEYQYQPAWSHGASLGAAFHYLDKELGSKDDVSAQASSYWHLTDTSKLTFGVAHKVRYPSMRNLYALSSGNPELLAEKSNHFELTWEQAIAVDTQLTLAGFYTDSDDYIAKDSDGFYQNLGDYRFQGVDFVISNQSFDSLSADLSYSYLDAEDKDAETSMAELEYRPEHQVRLQLNYEMTSTLNLNLNLERIMGQIFYSQEKVGGKKLWQQNKVSDYTLIDLNLRQQLMNDNLALYIRATNLLDEEYYQSEALPQAGRQIFIGLNWQI